MQLWEDFVSDKLGRLEPKLGLLQLDVASLFLFS